MGFSIKGHEITVAFLKELIITYIQKFFRWYGLLVSHNPGKFLLGSLLCALSVTFGIAQFRQEKNPIKLWVPKDSDFGNETNVILDKFKEGYRMQQLLVLAPNVLEPEVLQKVESIRNEVISFKAGNLSWEDVCFRIPTVTPVFSRAVRPPGRKKRSFFFFSKNEHQDELFGGLWFDPSLTISTSSYCSMAAKLEKVCLEVNLPQLWNNDEKKLNNLTLDDVIDKLNGTKMSPALGHNIEYPELLGGIERDEKGRIVSAKSLLSLWLTHVNFSQVNMDETGNAAGTGDWAGKATLEWETGFLDVLEKKEREYRDTEISIFYEAGRSFGDISSVSMFQDMGKLVIGSVIMFIFVQLVLPERYNWVDLRFGLGCVGLICIFLSFVVTVSICSVILIPYGPVHTSLPFLLLGIGVDDMFVVASCYKNINAQERKGLISEKVALIVSRAGVSITITSITDFIAFGMGAVTVLPSLQSFCIYASTGIIVMFFFQATTFLACFCFDEMRIAAKRNSIMFWKKHNEFTPHDGSQSFESNVFEFVYRKFIFKTPTKILIMVITIVLTAFAIYGNIEIKQKFDPKWFLPENSYLLKFFNERQLYYPNMGMNGAVFIGRVNYSTDFVKIHKLTQSFENETKILKSFDCWTTGLIKYTRKSAGVDLLTENFTDYQFREYLSKFIWSPMGAKYQKNIKFENKLECGKPTSNISISSCDFILRNFNNSDDQIPAMNYLKGIAKDANITSGDKFISVWSRIFANWVTDEVIDRELYRNLGMALACVMVCSAILIVDLQMCIWIFSSVFLTLVDVAGFIYYWGLHIDVTTCIAMVLAVGLCVDFAAHIGHVFLTINGTREERALKTVKYIGTATLNGAFSTFLAVFLLGTSDSYVFQTFFKIFFLIIIFGLFHGIFFLPVVLSVVGPKPYTYHFVPKKEEPEEGKESEETEMLNQPKIEDTEA